MKNYVIAKTKNGNKYIHDIKLKKTIYCPPLLYHIIEEIEKGGDIDKLLNNDGETTTIGENESVLKSEIDYYYRKYLLMKDNGFFSKTNPKESQFALLNPEMIKQSIANSPILTFETTDRCNLSCKYCGYGKFYSNFDRRENKDINTESATCLLRYLQKLWNSSLNFSHDSVKYIGFYGGEPLLNFSFIQQIIKFMKTFKLKHNRICYSITTNGLLLDKYMDFLVENDFNILISLDGDEKNNGYRIFKNGKPAYQAVLKNISALKKKHPEYFEKKVYFNSVVHNKNSVNEIYEYFKEHFDKFPSISPLNTTGVDINKKKEFWNTYSNITESLYNSEDYSNIEKEMFINLPNIQSLTTFLHHETDLSFKNYNEAFYNQDNAKTYPTGTCMPFSKKIFMTVNGKIMVCERIGHEHAFGMVSPEAVSINYDSISDFYNRQFQKLEKQCNACYNANSCIQCIFHLSLSDENPVCPGFMNREDYSKMVSSYIDYLEQRPHLYNKIFKEVWVH